MVKAKIDLRYPRVWGQMPGQVHWGRWLRRIVTHSGMNWLLGRVRLGSQRCGRERCSLGKWKSGAQESGPLPISCEKLSSVLPSGNLCGISFVSEELCWWQGTGEWYSLLKGSTIFEHTFNFCWKYTSFPPHHHQMHVTALELLRKPS